MLVPLSVRQYSGAVRRMGQTDRQTNRWKKRGRNIRVTRKDKRKLASHVPSQIIMEDDLACFRINL